MREQKRNWWKRFLRARRKRDAVKITLLLAVAAVGFGAAAISRGVTLYRQVSGFLEESGGDDTSAAVRPQNQVKLMPAEGILDQHAPMTVTVAESGNALTGEGQVRVCFRRRDLDGSQKQQMEKLGFLLENQTDVLEAEYQKETLLLRMKYEALIGALLGIGAVAVYKYGKK